MTWTLRCCVALSLIGAVDVGWYHLWTLRLYARAAASREELAHLCRGLLFVAMLSLVAFARPAGTWSRLLLALFAIDAINTAADVWVERDSRRDLGGLSRGEYLVHVVGSVAIGMTCAAAFFETAALRREETGFEPYAADALPEVMLVRGCLVLAAIVLGVEAALHLRARRSQPSTS